jgi:hypothetical protein
MAGTKNADKGRGPGGQAEMGLSQAAPVSLKRLLPLYAVVFAGFVGYSATGGGGSSVGPGRRLRSRLLRRATLDPPGSPRHGCSAVAEG